VRIEGLQNGIPYAVSIVAIDKLGNPSIVSEALLAQPVPTRDFYSGYRAAGGDSEGGCSVGGRGSAGAALGLAGLALLLVRRRKERHQ
jgi:MYXO-CTERM domain-containing protein